MVLPTFLIAGAQKCGTTTLSGALRQHPEIFLSKPKELHFFDRRFDRGLDWYSSHFTPSPRHKQVGEATPAYMFDPDARRRFAEALPGIRIVVILRDPVSRAYSHYWHQRRLGNEQLPTFEEAVAAEPERRASPNARTRLASAYLERGRYIAQIEPLVETHGRDHVHVMLLDDLVADRVGALRTLLQFLDVDAGLAEQLEDVQRNSYRVSKAGGAERTGYTPMAEETRIRLQEYFADSNARLERFLGRDLSHWQRA